PGRVLGAAARHHQQPVRRGGGRRIGQGAHRLSRLEALGQRTAAFLRDPRRRRRAYALAALLLALLCLFPRPYVARAKVVPQDYSSIGLGSMMGALGSQFQNLAALFGGSRQPTDMYLAIGRGTEVTDAVIRRLKLVGHRGYSSMNSARLALERKVDIHSLTGGIIEIEVRTHDADQSEALTQAYVKALSDRIIALGRDRVERKRQVVLARFKEAADRVVSTETALNRFRQKNRLAAPEAELGSALSLRARLEAQLQAKQVELRTLEQFQ